MTDPRYLVVTAVGPDRPGLVSEVSALVLEAGGNIEDSRMAILGGEFALILMVSVSDTQFEAVKTAATTIDQSLGLACVLRETSRRDPSGDYLSYNLHVTGLDHPGIVQRVTSVLSETGVNLATFDSRVAYAAMSGTPMFILDALLHVPSEVALTSLRQKISGVCNDENLDYVLKAAS